MEVVIDHGISMSVDQFMDSSLITETHEHRILYCLVTIIMNISLKKMPLEATLTSCQLLFTVHNHLH
jgi:hypothetical protein